MGRRPINAVKDSSSSLGVKCSVLSEALRQSSCCVVYTGAGISTAASIPDYRGPEGVWTLARQGMTPKPCDPSQAKPTLSHMALRSLYQAGYVKHVLSQNCDGLHLRSGMPQVGLSEVHGNMYIEVCTHCQPQVQFVRDFDVTTKTSFRRHSTDRKCDKCGSFLQDTIVHFGERGRLRWPLNWEGVLKVLEKCDMILCLGTSLGILKKYSFLWLPDRPKALKPKLFIVSDSSTPKDYQADLKLNGSERWLNIFTAARAQWEALKSQVGWSTFVGASKKENYGHMIVFSEKSVKFFTINSRLL